MAMIENCLYDTDVFQHKFSLSLVRLGSVVRLQLDVLFECGTPFAFHCTLLFDRYTNVTCIEIMDHRLTLSYMFAHIVYNIKLSEFLSGNVRIYISSGLLTLSQHGSLIRAKIMQIILIRQTKCFAYLCYIKLLFQQVF